MTREEAINELKEDIELYMPSDPILLDRELPDGRLITALEMAIEALEQEPKSGNWIDDMELGYHVSICSNCNWRGHGSTCLRYRAKYCPNCGARMEGDKHD